MTYQSSAAEINVATNNFGEQYLPAINKNVFNRFGAKHVFKKQFRDSLWEEGAFQIIIGTDSGLLINYILEHGIPENTRFLFIELDEVINEVRNLSRRVTTQGGNFEAL